MLEYISQLDKNLTLFLNQFHNPIFDSFFYLISQPLTSLPIYLLFLYYSIQQKKYKILYLILGLLITIALCDITASKIFKPLFERLRPTHDPSISNLVHTVNGYLGGKFGFASSHAANHFGITFYWLYMFYTSNKKWAFLIIWALIVSYSRIYLGVHFMGDILMGILIGLVFSLLTSRFIKLKYSNY